MPTLKRKADKAGKGRRAERRRRPLRRWQRWALSCAAVIVSLSLLGGGVYQLWRLGLAQDAVAGLGRTVDTQVRAAGMTVQDVLVSGRAQAQADDVLAALDVARDSSMFAFSPQAARDRLVALEWIRDARVERRWPNTIVVHLDEHRPLALWQHKGRHVLIDRHGEVITRSGLGRFSHLPLVIGDDAPAHAAVLLDMLAQRPTLFARVEAAIRVGKRRWNIRLKDGIDVNLPEEGAQAAWAKLSELVSEHRILERDVAVIDLRLPDRLVVRMTPEAAKKRRQGKDT